MKKRYLLLLFTALALNCGKTFGQPSITYQPRSQTVILYQLAAFGVIASGTAPLSYQWRKDAMPIAGATNDQIVLAHTQFSDAGQYSVVVSNAESSLTSADATLTVNSPKGGDLDYSFAWGGSINDVVSSVAFQPDGKVLIAGGFSTVHGAARGRIARLNPDGTTDYTFMNGLSGVTGSLPGLGGPVVGAVAVQSDGKVLIGGIFSTVNGVSRNGIARLNADGTLDNSFQGGVGGVQFPTVSSLTMQRDGKVLIGGTFTAVNGVGRTNIARINADGTPDTGFQNGLSGADGTILSIAVQSDGKVLIGGYFTTVNGARRTNIARLNTDGSLDSSFQNGLSWIDRAVSSVGVQSDGKVLIGGAFEAVNGQSRSGIARLNADGTLDNGFQNGLSGVNGVVLSVGVQSDGKVLIGGQFTTVNGASRTNIARLNADGALDGAFGFQDELSGPSSEVTSLALQNDGKVLVGGIFFTTINGVNAVRIARFNANGTLDGGFQNGLSGVDGQVNSVAVQSDSKVIIAGRFSSVNGVSRNNIARLNADGTLDSAFQNGLPEFFPSCCSPYSVAVQSDGMVLVGGFRGIARLNADGTLDTGFQNGLSGTDGQVSSVAVQSDGKVLIGGAFDAVDGQSRSGIARLNADGTLDNGFLNGLSVVGPNSSGRGNVWSLALESDGKVLIGGYFDTVNGVRRHSIARLNTDGTLDGSFQNALGCCHSVYSLAVQSDGKVLIGDSGYGIARLNADGTLDTGFQGGFYDFDPVWSVAVQSDGKVLIGGSFTTVDGVSRNGIARLNADGTLDIGFLNGLSGVDGGVSSFGVQSDGKVLIGGQFTIVNGVPAAGVARLWSPPQIKSINRSGADVNLSWYPVSNRTYRVQYTADLSADAWTDLAGDVSATGATASKTDMTSGDASQRFYRVVLLP